MPTKIKFVPLEKNDGFDKVYTTFWVCVYVSIALFTHELAEILIKRSQFDFLEAKEIRLFEEIC